VTVLGHHPVDQHPSTQPLPHQFEHPSVRHPLTDQQEKSLVVDLTEEVPNVGLEDEVITFDEADPEPLQASVADRLGRNPNEQGGSRPRKWARGRSWSPAGPLCPSRWGCPTAFWTRRASISPVALLSGGRCLHGGFVGVHRAGARPHRPPPRRGSDHRPPPLHDWLGTRLHASSRTSLLEMRSYRAWKRRPSDCLAAAHSRFWSVALCGGHMTAPGSWTGGPGHALALTSVSDVTEVGVPSLLPCSSRRSAVLRPRRTPAALRSISPLAYTSGLC